ncbi:hypothetical protein HIM_02185 [Hirsutella minnesotensis 3608]|nr:hypothetical protein HIM_02185 [Hirsutella minnesotensis 3608]
MAPRDGLGSRSPAPLHGVGINARVDTPPDVVRRAEGASSEPPQGPDGASSKEKAKDGVADGVVGEPKEAVGGNFGNVESQIQDLERAKKLLDDAKAAYDAQIQKLKSSPAGKNETLPDTQAGAGAAQPSASASPGS